MEKEKIDLENIEYILGKLLNPTDPSAMDPPRINSLIRTPKHSSLSSIIDDTREERELSLESDRRSLIPMYQIKTDNPKTFIEPNPKQKSREDYIPLLPKINEYMFIKNIPNIEISKKEYIVLSQKKESYILYNSMILPPTISSAGISVSYNPSLNIITAENIAEAVLPLVQYIHDTKPDFVIASDRGARLIGLAVAQLYKELYGRLPTVDGTLRFRRFSKSNNQSNTKKHLKPLAEEIMQKSKRKKPVVLVLDDWVCSGGTKSLARTLLRDLTDKKVDVKFGVLIGGEADVSGCDPGTTSYGGTVDWHDNTNMIGVEYHGVKPRLVHSLESFEYRRRMYGSIRKFAKKLKKKVKA